MCLLIYYTDYWNQYQVSTVYCEEQRATALYSAVSLSLMAQMKKKMFLFDGTTLILVFIFLKDSDISLHFLIMQTGGILSAGTLEGVDAGGGESYPWQLLCEVIDYRWSPHTCKCYLFEDPLIHLSNESRQSEFRKLHSPPTPVTALICSLNSEVFYNWLNEFFAKYGWPVLEYWEV